MADIFISYARNDFKTAQALAEYLTNKGLTVWWDFQLYTGERFSKKIEEEITNATEVIVLWSRTSVESGFVEDEASLAKEQNKLKTFRLEDCTPPLGFRNLNYKDVNKNNPDFSIIYDDLERVSKHVIENGETARQAAEERFWQEIEDSDDVEDFELYLNEFPDGQHVALARLKIRKLERVISGPEPIKPEQQRKTAVKPKPKSNMPWLFGLGGLVLVAVGVAYLLPEEKTSVVTVEPQKKQHGDIFQDCPDCPSMIVVKGGSFMMGSPKSEKWSQYDEGPQRRVRINKLAVGRYEVTRGQFDKFVKATGHKVGTECYIWNSADKKWEKKSGYSYLNPGYSQTDTHPVTCVNWNDVKSYVKWLSKTTGKTYRLLSEAEWEYVARGGTSTRYSFGDNSSDLCDYGNGADKSTDYSWRNTSCNDGFGIQTSSVGSFKPNPLGLYDVHGNVWEWVEDCWHKNYKGAPNDGRAWLTEDGGDCSTRVLRGGSWVNGPRLLRSANRLRYDTSSRYNDVGFRVSRTLGAASQ